MRKTIETSQVISSEKVMHYFIIQCLIYENQIKNYIIVSIIKLFNYLKGNKLRRFKIYKNEGKSKEKI